MKGEWDINKNTANILKHGISFEEALEVFKDPYCFTYTDTRFNYGEERLISIGEVTLSSENKVIIIFVAHTERNGNQRLISARKAKENERIIYEQRKFSLTHD